MRCGKISWKGKSTRAPGNFDLTVLVVLGLEMFHQTLDVGQAGDQVGALIKGVKRDEVRRGMVIAKPGTMKICNRATAQVLTLSGLRL